MSIYKHFAFALAFCTALGAATLTAPAATLSHVYYITKYGVDTLSFGTTHPSLPNYLSLIAGEYYCARQEHRSAEFDGGPEGQPQQELRLHRARSVPRHARHDGLLELRRAAHGRRQVRQRSRHDDHVVEHVDDYSSNLGCCGSILNNAGGHVATIVITPGYGAPQWIAVPNNHYTELATLEDAFGLSRLGKAAGQPATLAPLFK